MDKIKLKWNGFAANIGEYFRKVREDQKLFDVTLVTDDGHHIQAHEIILSAGSNFFSDIFLKSNHNNMVVYLKGISSEKLEPVIDFLYNGEVFINQEDVKFFIEIGEELQVKGIEGEVPGLRKNEAEIPILINSQKSEQGYDDYKHEKVATGKVEYNEDSLGKIDECNVQLRTNYDVTDMVEKSKGLWKCNICGKTATKKQHIQYHAETHIQGISNACHICSKMFKNRHSLTNHIYNIHTNVFSCDICGKTDMNKLAYLKHKRRMHS